MEPWQWLRRRGVTLVGLHREAVWLALWAARLARVEARWAATRLGYVVRPYDPLADARRWWWRRAQPCGWLALTEEQREAFAADVDERMRQREETDDG